MTGSARLSQEASEKAAALTNEQGLKFKQRELERKRKILDAQIIAMRTAFESEEDNLKKTISEEKLSEKVTVQDRAEMGKLRKAINEGDNYHVKIKRGRICSAPLCGRDHPKISHGYREYKEYL